MKQKAPYRGIFEASNDAFLIFDLKGVIREANPAACEMHGYPYDEMIGLSGTDFVHPDYQYLFKQFVEDTPSGKPFAAELVEIRKDGSTFNIEVRGSAFEYDSEPHILAIIRDVTGRKRTEEKLKHLNDILRVIRNVNQLITKEKDRVRLISRSCELLVETRGYACAWLVLLDENKKHVASAQAGLGDEFAVLIERMENHVFNECSKRALKQSGAVVIDDQKSVCGDCPIIGHIPDLRAALTIRLEHEGRIFGLLSVKIPAELAMDYQEQELLGEVASDIAFALYAIETEEDHKQAENELEAKSEFLERLIQQSPLPTFVLDHKGVCLVVNDAFLKLYAIPDKDLIIGSNALTVPENIKYGVDKYFRQALKGEETNIPVIEYISPYDKKKLYVKAKTFPIFDPEGKLTNVLVMQEDITEQKQSEEKEKENIKNIRLLYESAIRFVEFPPDKDIYSYIGDQIRELAGKDTIVTVNSNDMENRILTARALSGAGSFVKRIVKLMGIHPVGMTFNTRNEDLDYLSDGKLHLYKEGLYGILLKTVPKTICVAIEKLMNTDKIYTIGFIKENQIFGTVVIFMPKGVADLINREIIETFIKQASIVIQRRQVEEALRESEQQFRLMAENSIDCIWMLDTRLRFTYLSPSVEEILGYEPEQMVGTKLLSYFKKKEFLKVGALAAKAIKNHKTFTHVTFETRMLNSKNKEVDLEITSKTLFNDQGKLIGLQGTTRDITERKKAEESLRESEEKFRSMSSAAQDAIIMIEGNGKVVLWNNSAERILGYTPDEILGREFHVVIPPERYKEAYRKGMSKFKKTGQGPVVGKTIELEAVRKDGTEIPVELSLSAVMLAGRWCAIGIIRDITDRKRAEEEKARIENQYRQAQKMESVGRLAGGVAHDFNNMLGVILGYTEMSLEKVDPAHPVYAALQEIRKAADRSANLTRQLLAFARSQTVSPRVLDLNETLEGMLKMLHRLIGEDIDLVWLPGTGLWPVKVDTAQIDQVLANLCVNSRDAIDGVGRMIIETENVVLDGSFCREHAGSVPGEYVLLAVSDDGCGMDRKILDNLFEPFFTTKKVGHGTGLGLATVYGIVKQNNGFVYVNSKPGEGTTFSIYLPRHVGKAAQMQKKDPAEPAKRGHETILLVEDEPSILKMATTMLERQGYTVLAATLPGEAIRLAGEYDKGIHLLMTDVVMPEMNGRDLAENILLFYPDIKRLFMSGYTTNVIAHRRVLDEGVNFIQKPFLMQDLAAKVRKVLDSE